jgi:hypothetical protein
MASTSPLPVVSTLPSRILRSILLQAAINCMLSDLSRPRERERSMVHGDDRMKRAGPTKHFSSPAAGSTATPSDPPPGNGLNTCAHTRRLRLCQAGRRCALTVKYSFATYHSAWHQTHARSTEPRRTYATKAAAAPTGTRPSSLRLRF